MSKHRRFNNRQDRPTFHDEENVRKHVVLPEVEVKMIKEPHPICSICGQQIDFIADAISEKDGSYSHFDCVLNKIAKEHNVTEPDKVSYIGHGTFAICTILEDGKFTIKEKIDYESVDSFTSMKNFVEGSKNE